ncbi:MAG: hypothetical protein P8X63_11095 [Desulfuromonadaceae bacterium]
MLSENTELSLDPVHFTLWSPAPGHTIHVGAEQTPFSLPHLPLPVRRTDLTAGEPSDNAVGQGVYDYLRQFPDCPHNREYAELLRDAFPHFLSDLGAQILMLDHKEVESQYIQRKITYMKILALLDSDNPGMLLRLGMEYYNLSQMFAEFLHSRQYLLSAMGYFHQVLRVQENHLGALNYLGQIEYLFGDYPSAIGCWRQLINLMEEGPARQELSRRVEQLSARELPTCPLIDEYEHIGQAMDLYGRDEIEEAAKTLDIIEEQGQFAKEFASPEFYYFLALCRSKTGDPGGAFAALEKSLELNPDYAPANEARERFWETGSF